MLLKNFRISSKNEHPERRGKASKGLSGIGIMTDLGSRMGFDPFCCL